jgi:transcriptional regulator with XRE-family HTH domain
MMNTADIEYLDRDLAREVAERFLMAVDTIMGNRKAGKVSQKDIGDVTGMNNTNISRLRNDPSRGVSINAVCRLCAFYKVSTFWILLGEGQMWSNDELLTAYRTLENRMSGLEKMFTEMEQAFSIIRKSIKTK